MNKELLERVAGDTDLLGWFAGRVPSFHDAEVLALHLDRKQATCHLKIHAFEMSPQVNAEGQFVTTKHVVVSFALENLSALSLTGFNHQNVIYGLSINRTPDGAFCLKLEPCSGFSGAIKARSLRISLEPGVAPGSQYTVHSI